MSATSSSLSFPSSSRGRPVRPTMPRLTRRMEERYEKVEKVGEGAYGIVFKARMRNTDRVVAMKKIRFEQEGEGIPATALREIAVLKKLRCENVVGLNEIIHEDKKLFLVFEYLDRDLKAYMDSIGPEGMHPNILKSFAKQLLRGLAECHCKQVLHRDLKPQNLLIDTHGNLKLADFGLARTFKTPLHKYTHEVVTLWYRPPEILLGSEHYSTGADLWAAACVIAEMSNLAALFPGTSEIDQLFQVFRVLGTPNKQSWPGVTSLQDYSEQFPKWPARRLAEVLPHMGHLGIDLLTKLFKYDPLARMTAREAIDHPFFSDFEEH